MAMYHPNWSGQMGQGVNEQTNYSQALTPNSTTSSTLDQSGDQPRARKLNENCRCQFCGKCFQVSKSKVSPYSSTIHPLIIRA